MKPSLLFVVLLLATPCFTQKRMQIPSGCAFDTDVKNEKGDPIYHGCATPATSSITAPESTKAVEDIIKNRKSGFSMKFVEGGTFTMGSPTTETGRDDDECMHQITVATFKIGYYEVTQADWNEVVGTQPSGFKNCDDCPVEQVSWDDIQQFLAKLNEKTGGHYRLPTEAEWEYAARGGSQSKGYLYAGGDILNDVAWNDENSGSKTHPVGGKKANELGLYDMSGNVCEWCQVTYRPYPCDNTNKANDWARVLRGGAWKFLYPGDFRSAEREYTDTIALSAIFGFRLAED